MQSGKSILELIFELKGSWRRRKFRYPDRTLLGRFWPRCLPERTRNGGETDPGAVLPLTAGLYPNDRGAPQAESGPRRNGRFDRLNLWLEQGTERGEDGRAGNAGAAGAFPGARGPPSRGWELGEKGDCYDPLPCAADHEMLTDAEQYSAVRGRR